MNARDELAQIIRLNRRSWVANSEHTEMEAAQSDAILAAGYRKSRTITTAEELDALPNESIIRTRLGTTWEAMKATTGETFWRTLGPAKVLTSEVLARWNLPGTVLWEPES